MLNVAVIGCGYWGPNLVRNLFENRHTNRVLACDLDLAKLQRVAHRYPSVEVTTDYREFLRRLDVDAVMIATPLSTHYDLALEALRSGKHVFVEKPFAASTDQALHLIEEADRRRLTLMVGHTFQYSPPVIKIREIVEAGELGQLFYISSTRVNLGLHQKDVSVIWDLAPHDLSMILYWLDEAPVEVLAAGKDFVQKGIPDVAFMFMRFASGAIAHVQVSWLAPSKLRRTTIVGDAKMLVYDDTEHLEQVKIFDKGVHFKDPDTFGEYQLSYRTGDIVSPKIESFEPLQAEVNDFLTAIIQNRPPRSDGQSGLRVVRVLEAAER
ncbi:MAG: gfo/Idh/MocA family oxidoreductase, partial [Candidatus Eisenbacteria bacterium]|nr:gfo/Idh/MocA family oxidoreductase [Candidatus Latescibacterota bacterium]MBD3303326.1 gfo/Idh/MocA family oxidoreductase [Candidatus Eisenbacteria bacterium]